MDDFPCHCDICHRGFRTFQSQIQHLYSGIHGPDPYPYKCNGECGEEFHTEDELIRHIDELHCIVCDRSFGDAHALQQHVRDSPSHEQYWEAYGVTALPSARRRQRRPNRRHDAGPREPAPDMVAPLPASARPQRRRPSYAASMQEFSPTAPMYIEQQLLDAAAAEAALIYAGETRSPEPNRAPAAASPRPASHGSPDFDFDFEFRAGLELPLPHISTPESVERVAVRSSQPPRSRNLRHASTNIHRRSNPTIGEFMLNPFLWLDAVADELDDDLIEDHFEDHPYLPSDSDRYGWDSSASSSPVPSSVGDLADHISNLAISPTTVAESVPLALPKPPTPPPRQETPVEVNLEPREFVPLSLQDELISMAGKMATMQAKMNSLEAELAKANAIIQQEESLRQCGMCYERKTDCATKCGHQFCGICIDSWQAQHPQPWQTPCPMCRKPMGKAIRIYRADSTV